MMRAMWGAVALASLGAATPALAARPVLASEATFGVPGGDVLVHYATAGADAVPVADTNTDGVPDFVAEVANTAEVALQHFIALGFRRPLADGALGGDGRIDIYLRDLVSSDGNAGIDACTGDRCIGYASSENDFAGYAYSSITEGIRSVVPHELFHLVQDAYSAAQPSSWTEGSAVWAVENLYGTGNSDFERFLPSFVPRMYRPFERQAGGFGDAYPYGAALWPYFIEQRFGVGAVVAAWSASEQREFLDAWDQALAPFSSSTDAAWIEMTRWNLYTGANATGGGYLDASAWPEVMREAAVTTAAPTATIYVEGLSARYVPVSSAARAALAVAPTKGIEVAAWVVRAGATVEQGVALAGAPLSTTLEPGDYTLVITGLSRGTITTATTVSLGPPPAAPDDDDDDDGGCAATRPSSSLLVLAALALLTRSGRASRGRGTARRRP